MTYDSAPDTIKHSARVKHFIHAITHELEQRAATHDNSKLHPPEKEMFDKLTPKLKELKYGSEEYQDSLDELQGALEHHYTVNRHHPEHHENGIDDMNLVDVIEMLCDWIAAAERTKDGSIERSIVLNKDRFGMSDQLANLFWNTVEIVKGHENEEN